MSGARSSHHYTPHFKQKRHTSVDREFSARHVTTAEHSPLYNAYPSPSADPGVDPSADPVSVPMQRGDSGVGKMQQSRHEDTETDALERRMSDVSMDDVLMGDAIESFSSRAQLSSPGSSHASTHSPPSAHTTVGSQQSGTTFSMGWRADCEKCQLRVPGHYVHIARGEK
ncbi:hypothetical protein BC937DRAFT_93064 [Endogone sp. FLAS-F59071]|nr:hypothetical protein BC937DRAFT_93064 [Endogone sp. FLAS-F59071]|eukprot:RUS14982.1 hypothetical protein BC937DRAFT_93064 [Endogone sp. FLAS-F59071]